MYSAVKLLSLNHQTAKEFSICNFLRQCTLFHSSSSFYIPITYQQCTSVQISTHSHQHLFCSFFFFFGSGHPNVYKVYIAFLK